MQSLIPGVSWGKKMNKKQFDEMYKRMINRQKKTDEVIKKEQDKKKDEETIGCTFKPKINKEVSLGPNRSKASRSPVKRDLRWKSPTNKANGTIKRIGNRDSSNIKNEKRPNRASRDANSKVNEEDFLKRIEEMKRRDLARKEATKRKYEDLKKKQFQNECTFQPNKLKKRRKRVLDKSRTISPMKGFKGEMKVIESQNFGEHLRNDSGIVVGKEFYSRNNLLF